jgi:hypothetical protein
MLLFLEFMGFHTTAGGILDTVGISVNNQTSELVSGDVTQSPFYLTLFGASGLLLAIGLAGAVIVGFFTKTFDWKIALLPFITGILVLFVGTGWQIVQFAQNEGQAWLTGIIAMIFLPLTVGFIYSIVEFFAGGGD